jgi:hypothetical protein
VQNVEVSLVRKILRRFVGIHGLSLNAGHVPAAG